MAESSTAVCNFALSRIGEQRILTIDGEDERSIACRLFYEDTVKEVLRLHEWNCASFRSQLSKISETPLGGEYAYAYSKPEDPDCLRVLRIINQPKAKYKVENERLLANIWPCIIEYTGFIIPPKWDAALLWAIVTRLAWRLTFKLTGAKDLRRDLYGEFKDVLGDAIGVDQQEKFGPISQEPDETDSWVDP
ncbi:MAG: hypothetical protein JXQ30_08730 [Spirochaetes bacterium]|nr:hypothetical protein [Spirochaetota bacterium]